MTTAAVSAAAREWINVLTPDQKAAWNARALVRRDENVLRLTDDVAAALSSEAIDAMRDEEELRMQETHGLVARFDTCRFSDKDLVALDWWMQNSPSKAELQRRRDDSRQPPGVPCDEARQAMVDLGDLGANLDSRLPEGQPWERTVASLRDHLGMCVLAFGSLIEWHYYLFLYASKSPYFVGVAPLRVVDDLRAELDTATQFEAFTNMEPFDWVWRLLPGEYVHSFEMQHVAGLEVVVIPQATPWHQGYIASHASPMRLAAFAAGCAVASQAGSTARTTGLSSRDDDLSLGERCPWTRRWATEDLEGDAGAAFASVPVAESGLTDEQIEEITSKLDLMRREWHADHGHGSADFRTELTGGAWAKANLGCDIDGVRSSARGLAAQFCTDFGFCKSSSYSFKVYGERLSNSLSLEWAAKMQFFYDGYLERGS